MESNPSLFARCGESQLTEVEDNGIVCLLDGESDGFYQMALFSYVKLYRILSSVDGSCFVYAL